jgi:hypothetical protein
MARQLQGRGLPQVQWQHQPSTVYHELSSRYCIVRRGRRHDGQVLHHRPRRSALTWYTRLPPLSIDSWRSLRDKFLLNFQGYRPDTDALAELSLCKQLEKETLWEYYRKFLTLKSQLPSVDDKLPFTTPSVAFGLSSSTATASGTHQRTSRSSINCLKNMPDPKSSTSARSSPRGNPRTLHSPVERGQDLRSQTPVGTTTVSSRCITLPTSIPPVRPLAVKIIPPGPRQWHSWSEPRVGAAAAQILLPVSR